MEDKCSSNIWVMTLKNEETMLCIEREYCTTFTEEEVRKTIELHEMHKKNTEAQLGPGSYSYRKPTVGELKARSISINYHPGDDKSRVLRYLHENAPYVLKNILVDIVEYMDSNEMSEIERKLILEFGDNVADVIYP